MKNIFKLLMIAILSISFSSCSSDKENNNDISENYSDLIIGEWQYIRYERETNGVIVTINEATECQLLYTQQKFFSDGEHFYRTGTGTIDDCGIWEISGTYNVNGNMIEVSSFEMDYSILTLNTTTFKYRFSVCEDDCNDWNIYTLARIE